MDTPYFLAIVGGSASGKTELASALIASLPVGRATLLREDDYYHCSSRTPGFDPALFNFDEPAAKEQTLLAAHLVLMRNGAAIDRPNYDFTTHKRLAKATTIRPAPLVVVEGLHVLATPVLAAAFDASIFVETSEPVRLARRMERDTKERGRTAESVAHQFKTRVAPMHAVHVAPQQERASLSVRGEDPLDALVSLARRLLPERIKA
jgi:uridine kinase